ncbi:MAG: bifunctional oligoribonuclease/PAP phosphatase NrnA [Clostridia bacterium]|nr:bifunctional oligoribonuclease/PAP phosphatase NrnA [Clostridia bacterium]
MKLEQMQAILAKIKEYQRIIIFRHKRPDGDAVGSTGGLRAILRRTYPEKEIYLINNDFSDYVSFLIEEEPQMPDAFYREALGIVIDTATTERISNPKFALCRELVKIDHHIEVQSYGDYEWVEEEKSSSCEMIAEFYHTFRDELQMDAEAATAIYTGMVTDSGRFRIDAVTGDTMRYAGMLLDHGVDTQHLYAHLYMKEFNTLKFQAYVYKKMQITPNGVAYLYVDRAMQKKFGLTVEQASASVSYMDSIKNSLIWIAFIENADRSIRVRLRSRFVTISDLAEKYRGGGHACASGATVYGKKEIRALLADADALLKEYKEQHEGWL